MGSLYRPNTSLEIIYLQNVVEISLFPLEITFKKWTNSQQNDCFTVKKKILLLHISGFYSFTTQSILCLAILKCIKLYSPMTISYKLHCLFIVMDDLTLM